jgi:opacity protein-like surface antigen
MLKKLACSTALIVCLATPMAAQKIEVSPFIGGRMGGSVPVQSEVTIPEGDVNKIKFDSGLAYGVSAGYNMTEHLGVEFMWSRQDTNAVAQFSGGGQLDEKADAKLDQFLGNILVNLRDEEEKFRPFLLFGLGATRAAALGSSETKFAFTAGGGVKYWFSQNIGIRAQARWAPTYLFSTPGGTWCNWWGYCYIIPNDHFMNQVEATVGASFRF